MTLREIINLINDTANDNPNINHIVESGNIFDLNTNNVTVKYAAFCGEQLNHVMVGTDWVQYNFRLYYADRVCADNSNVDEIQSTAIRVLNNIVLGLERRDDIQINTSRNISIFEQRFEALTAGAYIDINITCPVGLYCEESYSVGPIHFDFNNDFNLDFN